MQRKNRRNPNKIIKSVFVSTIVLFAQAQDVTDESIETLKVLLMKRKMKKVLDTSFDFGVMFDNQLTNVTALEFSIIKNNVLLMTALLAAGADPNAGHALPLCLAASLSSDDVIYALLNNHVINEKIKAKQVNVNWVNTKGIVPLHYAAMNNKTGAVKLLLADPNIKIHKQDDDGATALEIALGEKHDQCINLLFNKIILEKPVITNEKLDAIRILLKFNQKERAFFLFSLICKARDALPNTLDSEELIVRIESLLLLLVHQDLDVELYDAFMRASQIDINQVISSSDGYDATLLEYVCMQNEDAERINWVRFLISEGANPNLRFNDSQEVELYNAFSFAVMQNNVEICEVLLSRGIVSLQNINNVVSKLLPFINNKDMDGLIDKYTRVMICGRHHIEAPHISSLLYNAILKDKIEIFNETGANYYSALKAAVHYESHKIINFLLKSLNPFKVINNNGLSLFTILLLEENYDGVDTLWDFLSTNTYDLKNELIECKKMVENEAAQVKKEYLHSVEQCRKNVDDKGPDQLFDLYLEKYCYPGLNKSEALIKINEMGPKLTDDFTRCLNERCQRIKDKIHSLMNAITNESAREEFFYTESGGQTFFSGMSSRQFLRKELNITSMPEIINNDENIAKEWILSGSTTKSETTWFDGMTLEPCLLKTIDNHDSRLTYLVFLPEVDCHPDRIFESISRYSFDASCIKKLSELDLSITCTVEGNPFEFFVSHELKTKKTDDRILIASKSSDDKSASLYIAFKYLDGGLHTPAHTQYACESINKSRPLELDFLLSPSCRLGSAGASRMKF